MSLGESLTLTFTGLLLVATSAYVAFSGLLWKVSQRQKDIQADLRTIQLLTHKYTRDPDLRAFGRWDCKPEFSIGDSGPGTPKARDIFETWESTLHLWNTGSSTILVTDWTLEARPHSNEPAMMEPGGSVVYPPVVIPAQSSVCLFARIGGRKCRRLLVHYNTSASSGRVLPIPLISRFGYQNKESGEEDG